MICTFKHIREDTYVKYLFFMYTYPAQHDRTRAVPAQLGFSGEPTKGKIALRPTHMGIEAARSRGTRSDFKCSLQLYWESGCCARVWSIGDVAKETQVPLQAILGPP